MKRIIKNWFHKPGNHCGSTALSDLVNFYGIKLSEPICFGLGSGIGAFYLKGETFNPTHMLMTRTASLESDFFTNLGIPYVWRSEDNNETALKIVKDFINNDIPVLLQTDIYYIDYYKSKTHFNGHIVVLWGYDDDKGVAFVSDTGWEGLQKVSYASLEKARTSKAPPIILENNYFEVKPINNSFNLTESFRRALKKQADDMLRDAGMFGYMGIGAMNSLAQDFPSWAHADDWQWCARFSYQVIEKRGTGGGAFRKMYAQFVREAEKILPELNERGMSQRMQTIANQWTELSEILKQISESEKPAGFDEAGELMQRISTLEKGFYEDILRITF